VYGFWSSSDFAYMCLRDRRRTLALGEAVRRTVRPGDVVLDVGAGTGILSLFAARAGAGRVVAVEADPVLAEMLRATVAANGLEQTITVLAADIRDVDPAAEAGVAAVDVVLAELIETGLIEETLVPVLNDLYRRGVITAGCRVVPGGYRTRVQLVHLDQRAYGFDFPVFRHEWPFLNSGGDWLSVDVVDRGPAVGVWTARLDRGPVVELVDTRVTAVVDGAAAVNGVRILGEAVLADGVDLGACNTLNGDKIVPMPERDVAGRVALRVRYRMGGGLPELDIRWDQ
jgi:predicted RNA methylase